MTHLSCSLWLCLARQNEMNCGAIICELNWFGQSTWINQNQSILPSLLHSTIPPTLPHHLDAGLYSVFWLHRHCLYAGKKKLCIFCILEMLRQLPSPLLCVNCVFNYAKNLEILTGIFLAEHLRRAWISCLPYFCIWVWLKVLSPREEVMTLWVAEACQNLMSIPSLTLVWHTAHCWELGSFCVIAHCHFYLLTLPHFLFSLPVCLLFNLYQKHFWEFPNTAIIP